MGEIPRTLSLTLKYCYCFTKMQQVLLCRHFQWSESLQKSHDLMGMPIRKYIRFLVFILNTTHCKLNQYFVFKQFHKTLHFFIYYQVDDGKSIRYKDLYALFEQILEKTMRLEQRDWSESPVRVWVNTFKVFLDEYMNEFKTLDCIPTKVNMTNFDF